MRDFNHLILDLEIKKNFSSSANWLNSSLNEKYITQAILSNINISSKLDKSRPNLISDFEEHNNSNITSASFITKNNVLQNTSTSFSTNDVININFLRKERLYTKLKYSRSPAYDIVSGGAAAILAGFIGFLISEKFGFELVDSGDFYYLFIYTVFASFSVRPLLTTMNDKNSLSAVFSLKPILSFFTTILTCFLKNFKF